MYEKSKVKDQKSGGSSNFDKIEKESIKIPTIIDQLVKRNST